MTRTALIYPFQSLRLVALIAILMLAGIFSTAQAQVRITYQETRLGQGNWQYDYTFYNDFDPVAKAGFDLYDVSFAYDPNQTPVIVGLPDNWDYLLNPDAGILELVSIFVGEPPDGSDIAPGTFLMGSSISFDARVGDLPFTALVSDPNNLDNPLSIAGVATAEPTLLPPDTVQFTQRLIELINALRVSRGLGPLKRTNVLQQSAQWFADDMAAHDYFAADHIDRFGDTDAFRIGDFGYQNALAVGETVAHSEPTPAVTLADWVNDTDALTTLMSPDYREIGTGYRFRSEATFQRYWVADFGSRENVYPVIINNEAAVTTDPNVQLYIYGLGWASQMRLSNDGIHWTDWLPYQSQRPWQLEPGTGERTVTVELTNGLTTVQSSDSILLALPSLATDLSLTASASPIVVMDGDNVTYTFTVTNNSLNVASNVTVKDVLPSALSYVAAQASQGNVTQTNGTVTGQLGNLAPGDSAYTTLTVQTKASGTIVNTASVQSDQPDSDLTNNKASATITVTPTADLAILKTAAASAKLNDPLTYTLTVFNTGPDASTGVTVVDELPREVSFVSAKASQGTVSQANGVVTGTLGTLASGDHATITVIVTPNTIGDITNKARVSSDTLDRNSDNNQASATTTISNPDFLLDLAPRTQTLVPGSSVSFLIIITSLAGFQEPVTLSVDKLPSGITASLSPQTVTPSGTALLTLTAASNADTGSFDLRVTGTSGSKTHTASSTVTVNFGLIPKGYGAFEGTVTDQETGLPIPGASVSASTTVTTDSLGHYKITQVPLGQDNAPQTYDVTVNAPGYWYTDKLAIAVKDAVTPVNFQLLKQKTATVSGTVYEGVPDPNNPSQSVPTSTPIAGATVSLPGGNYTTDSNGHFQSDPILLGYGNTPIQVSVFAQAPDHWYDQRTITISATMNGNVTLALVPICHNTKITGTAYWRKKIGDPYEPMPEASVNAYGPQTYFTTTNDQGKFEFSGVQLQYNNTSASYTVLVDTSRYTNPRYTSSAMQITLKQCGDSGDVTIYVDPVPADHFAEVEGHIYDQDTGKSISDATVSGGGSSTTTDAEGYYHLSNINIGQNMQQAIGVSAYKDGYYAASDTVTVSSNQKATLDLRLLRQKFGRIAGTVRDIATHQPIQGATINVSNYPITDSNGKYQTGLLSLSSGNQPTTYYFSVTAPGYWTKSVQAVVQADQTTTVDVDLLAVCDQAAIVGTVVDATTQKPIEGASVSGGGQYTTTDAQGKFRLDHLQIGTDNSPVAVTVTASATGYYTQSKTVTIFCGATIIVEFGNPSVTTGSIEGVLTDLSTGKPMANVFIGSGFGASATTDVNGYYKLTGAPLNPDGSDRVWNVTAVPNNYPEQTKSVTVRGNKTVTLNFDFGTPPRKRTIFDLSARAKSSKLDLKWTPVVNAISYNVYRSMTTGGPYQVIQSGYITQSGVYLDQGLTNGTTYYYVVTSVAADGTESLYSNEASATPKLR